MKKVLLLLAVLLPWPMISHADISIGVSVPGVSLHIGDRDNRGYYWDGGRWREPRWWHRHYPPHDGYYYAPPPRVYYVPPPPPPRGWRDRPPHRDYHDHYHHRDRDDRRGPPRW